MSIEVFELFAKNFKKIRALRKISLEELSLKTGFSVNYLKKIENAKAKRLSTRHLDKFSTVFSIEAYKFFVED